MTPAAEVESLWSEHRTQLRRFISHHSDEDVDDVIQDVYLSALEAMQGGYGYTQNAAAWLYRTARNRMIDRYRARDREPQWVDVDELVDEDDSENGRQRGDVLVCDMLTPEDTVITKERDTLLYKAIGRLPTEQASVVYGRMAGREFSEIADELGKSDGACKALLQRGYKHLHERLANEMGYAESERNVRRSNLSPQIYALLLERGPMTARNITTALHTTFDTVHFALRYSGEPFVRLGYAKSERGKQYIWGIAGIHDRGTE